MKTERAIELLNRISDSQFDGIHGDERREALEMAVRALEPNLGNNGSICAKTGVNDEDRTTGDTIYRQDAIDAVAKWFYDVFGIKESDGTATIFKRLRELPSAQPEIIRCKDCKYFERDIQRSWGTYNGCGVWTDDGNEIEVNQDDFCSYAERREE